jgi:enoyl-CoA hydratase
MTLGIELLLAADIASNDARFAQLEIQRGIYPFGRASAKDTPRPLPTSTTTWSRS